MCDERSVIEYADCLQVVSSTNGELQGDDQVGGQSNAPITAPADVDNTETTKYAFYGLLVVTVPVEHIFVTFCVYENVWKRV